MKCKVFEASDKFQNVVDVFSSRMYNICVFTSPSLLHLVVWMSSDHCSLDCRQVAGRSASWQHFKVREYNFANLANYWWIFVSKKWSDPLSRQVMGRAVQNPCQCTPPENSSAPLHLIRKIFAAVPHHAMTADNKHYDICIWSGVLAVWHCGARQATVECQKRYPPVSPGSSKHPTKIIFCLL